jgi:putative ABC transport system substrate-binding protein
VKRRGLLAGATAVLLGGCAFQPPWIRAPKVARVGWLGTATPIKGAPPPRSFDRFRVRLAEHGWVLGQNLKMDFRYADSRVERLPGLAQELVALPLDAMVADGSPASVAAKSATSTLPIVGVGFGDPVGLGLVESLARPGGNMTVVATGSDSDVNAYAKDLEVLTTALPGLTRVAVLVKLAAPSVNLAPVEAAGRSLRIETLRLDVRSSDDFEPAFAQAEAWHAQALLAIADGGLVINTPAGRRTVAELALRKRLPAITQFRPFVEAGFAMAYGADPVPLYERAAAFIDRILRGANPADMPVELPTTYIFLANRVTLQSLGLTLPREVVAQVTEWIE